MTKLGSDNIPELLGRFSDFNDAVTRKVRIEAPDGVVIEVSARDFEKESQLAWVNVQFRFGKVVEHQCDTEEVFSRYQVMSSGLCVMEQNGCFYLDFAPYASEPHDLEDFRKSKCMVASDNVFFQVLPYAE